MKPKHSAFRLTYACDIDGVLWDIEDVPNGNACGCICPACGEPLMAKNQGTVRMHHFAHQSGTECEYAYESMLHILAKDKIREAFLNGESFIMEYECRSYCHNEKACHFVRYDECCTKTRKSFNLKDFYDSCEQEIPYDTNRRRSDLKIFSSTHPERKPIYIEFCVTHASDKEKLHSGNKIIEIKLESEQNVISLAKYGFIEPESHNRTLDTEEKQGSIAFYGFEKRIDYNDNTLYQGIEFVRYILYPSGKTRCFQDCCNCRNLTKASRSSLMEIAFHTPTSFGIYEYAKYIGYSKYPIQNCMVCKNYVDSYDGMGKLCRLYKHLQINRFEKLDTSRAKSCPHFSIDKEDMKKHLSDGPNAPYDTL